jgi:hypothetical protein
MAKKKNMTIDDLARIIEKTMATKEDLAGLATKEDIAAIRDEMATKDDLAAIRNEMATKDDLKAEVGALRSEMHIEFAKLRKELNFGPEIDELRHRVIRLEKQLGIK